MPLNALGVKDKEQKSLIDKVIKTKTITHLYRWQNDVFYQGKDFKGTLNVMDVFQLKEKTGEYVRKRAFVTNYALSEDTLEILEQVAQQRWKIENQGFDVQKNHGYALEHVYSHDYNAMKVVYQLIQIAHLINQLVLKADILGVFAQLNGCIKSYLRAFQMALQRHWHQLWENEWMMLKYKNIQIRWKE